MMSWMRRWKGGQGRSGARVFCVSPLVWGRRGVRCRGGGAYAGGCVAVISAYLEEKGLVRQQLDSFDEFIQNTIGAIVDESSDIEMSPESQHNPGRNVEIGDAKTSALKEIPVVVMSSENDSSRIKRCLAEGAEEFIIKPVHLSDVKRLMGHIRCCPSTTSSSGTTSESSESSTTFGKRKADDLQEVSSPERRPRLSPELLVT